MQKVLIALALTLIALLSPAHADNYPSRPITLIVPYPPGGGVVAPRSATTFQAPSACRRHTVR